MIADTPTLAAEAPSYPLDRGWLAGGRFIRNPILPMLAAGAAMLLLLVALGAAGVGAAEPWWGQVEVVGATIAGGAMLFRGRRRAVRAPTRAFRASALASAVLWLVVQLVALAAAASPEADLRGLEYALFVGWLAVVCRSVALALRGRFSPVETAAIWLDAATVFLTAGAAILLVQGPRTFDDPVATSVLVYAVTLGGLVGGMTVVSLAVTPVRRPSGWLAIMPGVIAVGIGLTWHAGSTSHRLHPGDAIAAVGVLLAAYGAATWTDEVDPSVRYHAIARRIRSAVPLLAVALAPLLLILNQLRLESNGALIGIGVDAAVALVLVASVVRQTLLLHDRGRLLGLTTQAADRERVLVADLQASEQRFRALVQNSSDVFLILGPDGTVVYQSPAVERVLGYPPDERVGRQIFEITHPEDIGFVQSVMRELLQTPNAMRTIELRSRHADGSWRNIEATGRNLLDDPVVGGIVVNYRDVTERKTLERQLIHEAFHDPLTGLSNRALFTDRVEHALARRSDVDRLAVLFMDIDDFKTINDSLGHAAGDLVLVAVAERVRACLRPEDTVSRLGGDEFAVLLEDAEPGLASQIANRLLESLRRPFEIAGKLVHLEASVGVAFGSVDTGTANEMLRNADVAMYTAKDRGKGRVQVFESSMHAAALSRLEMKADLERALAQDELRLRYQPVFDLRTGKLSGFEALLRWRHPVKGETFPVHFIGLAEETGLIVPIGRWVLEQACQQAMAWTDLDPSLTVGVNLSARQLHEAEFVDEVATILRETGLAPAALMLELTESSLMQDDEGRLRELRSLGLRLALDDFGTGYSSLSYLSRFPIDQLKIDRSFTAELGSEMEESALVRSVVQLARAMNMQTVAEGIERPEQLNRVAAIGCDFGQGFLLARPMDAIRATNMVSSGATLISIREQAS